MSSLFTRKSASSSSSSIDEKQRAASTSEVLTVPAPDAIPNTKRTYDQAQLKQIEELRAYTQTITLPESDSYYPWEARFLADPGCHPRYMRAAKWKFEDAKKRIKGTIEWRREYKPELIKPGTVGVEAESGKIILTGFDVDARPILYMRPGRENTDPSPRQIQHLIYHLERAIDFMPPGQEQVAIVVDYKSATSQSNPSISTARSVLNILQNHYVERLGRGLVVNMSWWINAFFSGISPFLDPITRDKIRFNPKMNELVPSSQLDHEFGGDYNFLYDYETYWKTITEFCRLAPDGTRLDKDGKIWYPPLGNGIKAATEGLVPKRGAVQTGEVVQEENGTAGEVEKPQTRKAVTGVDAVAVGGAAVATGGAAVITGGALANANTENRIAAEPELEKQQVPNGPQMMAFGAPTGSYAGTQSPAGTGGIEHGVSDLALSPPLTASTTPGKPEGDVVFDHPPSEGELRQARESLDQNR